MTIASYSDLKTKAAAWLRRSGNTTFVNEVADMVTLAEGMLNTELGPLESTATLTGTVGSNSISVSALTILEPISLFYTDLAGDEVFVQKQSINDLPYVSNNSDPAMWAHDMVTETLKFDCPLDQAYSFRFRYKGKFALSDSSTTNWLLETRPDVYLAAVLGWGSAYLQDFQGAAPWTALLDRELPKVQHMISKSKRGTLRVDPMLTGGGRYNIFTDR